MSRGTCLRAPQFLSGFCLLGMMMPHESAREAGALAALGALMSSALSVVRSCVQHSLCAALVGLARTRLLSRSFFPRLLGKLHPGACCSWFTQLSSMMCPVGFLAYFSTWWSAFCRLLFLLISSFVSVILCGSYRLQISYTSGRLIFSPCLQCLSIFLKM